MEGTKRRRKKHKCQDIPKIPIKTYKWEDVKRSRRRGDYPWTHLTKPPFDEELDPEAFTMEAFRRSRSTSTLGKSETQEISEIEDEHEVSEDMEKLTEINDVMPYDDKENIEHVNREETRISESPDTTKHLPATATKMTNPTSRSKSEEPKNKRKLSVESHGKINFPKLGLKNKFINAKKKINVPRLVKRTKSDVSENKHKKPKVAKSESTSARGGMPLPPNKSPVYIHIPLKPPPGETDEFSKYEFESPGPSSRSGSSTQLQRIGSGRKMSLLGLLTELKKVHDEMNQQKLASESRKSSEAQSKTETSTKCKSEEKQPKIELAESFKEIKPEFKKMKINSNCGGGGVQRNESDKLVIEEITNDDKNSTKSDTESLQKSKLEDPVVDEPEENVTDDNISQYLDKEDSCMPENSISKDGPAKTTVDQENVRKLEATLSKWKMQVPSSSSGIYPSKPLETTALKLPNVSDVQRPRARSEEPKRKRKGSIESSYSRKSLSKLGFMKRIKEATDKIKLPKFPSFSKTDKPVKEKEARKEEPEVKIKKKLEVKKSENPVYIHIPLKLPPGQKDEFSHFAEEIDKKIDHKVEEEEVKPEGELEEKDDEKETSPKVRKRGVQLIILTPPSDDEILDGVPETPSESDQKSLDSIKIDELKNLARKAVDQVCPDTIHLETVKEDEASDEHSGPESSQEQLDEAAKKCSEEMTVIEKPPVLIDEEDGLKLSDAAIAMINEELAKELKAQEMEKERKEMQEKELELKPSLKKKVSFKRKSRAEDGERIYEDVQINDAAKTSDGVQINKSRPLESFQSMSVDEEKSYLDKKVIKDTSLEDDYNKWSTSNDHEYEPVNPPPENIVIASSINNHLISTHQQVQESEDTTNKSTFVQIPTDDKLIADDENIDMQEVQNQIEERFFSTVPETKPPKSDEFHSSPPILKHPLHRGDQKATPTTATNSSSTTTPAKEESLGKTINDKIRTQTNKIKTKLQNIKRPKFPSTKLKKPHFSRPNFKMPKLPEKPSITLPSFMTRKESLKDTWRNRQLSTESNAGDSTKKVFDFKTYPRIFDKHKKSSSVQNDNEFAAPSAPEFATVPRASRNKGPVGSRWMDKFKDIKYANEGTRKSTEMRMEPTPDVIRIPLHPEDEDPIEAPSHTRYNEDIDIEDDFDRENCDAPTEPSFNDDYLQRWNHGEFHDLQYDREMNNESFAETNLDNGIEKADPQLKDDSFEIPHHRKEEHSSGSLSERRHGVLEEIDSDEFFLREKGISQENIEVGKYLSSEIREAFRNPINALSQLQSEDREYDLDISDQSEPILDVPRRKPLRKPKRKKTPHVSSEKINYDQESITTEPEEYPKPDYRTFPPPDRPRRRSKRTKKKKITNDDVIPYQETIPIEQESQTETIVEPFQILENNILRDDELLYRDTIQQFYENEHMKGIDQPEIKISDPYYRYENFHQDHDKVLNESEPPIAPTRKNRSLKSLDASEHSSIDDELIANEIPQRDVEAFFAQREYIIPTPEPPPSRPKRTRSRTHSQSGGEDDRTSREADSLVSDTPVEVPCVEEPCVQDIRDCMGYAVIEKLRAREPPLPPSRFPPSTPPRTRKSKKQLNKTYKFATTPRPVNTNPPVRPLRNYSTLGGSGRTSRSKSPTISNKDEKENIQLCQYIELEEDRNLQSGEIIKKMKDRPLPPPPRPPRRPKAPTREVFRDISHERNIPPNENNEKIELEGTDIATRSINKDFTNEQIDHHQDPVLVELEDQILTFEETITHAALVVQPLNKDEFLSYSRLSNFNESLPIEKSILINIETNEPDEDEEISVVPDEFTKLKDPPASEKPVPNENVEVPEITNDVKDALPQKTSEQAFDDEISEIPEEFTRLKDPPSKQSVIAEDDSERAQQENQQVGILNAQKMQVMDLDVDKLRVNELQASKIIVSELDGMTLQVSEINSKAGNLVVSGIELPPHIIQEMLQKLQSSAYQDRDQNIDRHTISNENKSEEEKEATEDTSQKKTPFKDLPVDDVLDEPPPVPPRCDSISDLLHENESDLGKSILQAEDTELNMNETNEPIEENEMTNEHLETPPVRPPRKSSQVIENVKELPAVVIVSKVIEETPAAQLVSKVIEDLEVPPTAELVSSPQTELAESSQTVEETKESPPRELPVLPIEPPESSSEISSKSEEPPPRPPEPVVQQSSDYVPSQPPASFYALRSPPFEDFADANIPLPPRRKHQRKAATISRSSSEEVTKTSRRQRRPSQEPSIPQLTGQLVCACAKEIDRSINTLILYIRDNLLQNVNCRQDLHIMLLILLILIAGLILLSGDERITIHHHHWEFFNPPKEL